MKIYLIAVGTKMPGWVGDGVDEYRKRLPRECLLELVEIPMAKRGKNADIPRLMRQEGERIAQAIPKGCRVVTLEVEGKGWTTPQLAGRLEQWLGDGRDVALLVGGPDGLDAETRRLADERWSLSNLTLPHPLVRIVVAEQIYRAWSLIQGHPYHR